VSILAGCGGGVSEDKPIAQVEQEAQTMDKAKLQAMVDKYKAAIDAKKSDIQQLQAQLKEIPMAELMGEKAKAIKSDIEAITDSVNALTKRMQVYASELSKK
jgi:SMC interacting uncharacterized protein involved in chromosome segregation